MAYNSPLNIYYLKVEDGYMRTQLEEYNRRLRQFERQRHKLEEDSSCRPNSPTPAAGYRRHLVNTEHESRGKHSTTQRHAEMTRDIESTYQIEEKPKSLPVHHWLMKHELGGPTNRQLRAEIRRELRGASKHMRQAEKRRDTPPGSGNTPPGSGNTPPGSGNTPPGSGNTEVNNVLL